LFLLSPLSFVFLSRTNEPEDKN